MKGTAIEYIPEELAWIEAHKDWSRRDLHRGFCARFGRRDVTVQNLKRLCIRKGWNDGIAKGYAPGHVPANKGKKQPFNANSARTQFKKGQLPHNAKGAGHEYVDTDGYIILIIDEPNPWRATSATRPVHKHRWLWEKANGPVPDGMRLKCLDGNKTNTALSNWEAIPDGLAPRLNGIHGRGYDKAPAELKPAIMAVAKLAHQAATLRKGAR